MNDELVYRPPQTTAIVPVPETVPPTDRGVTVEQVAEALIRATYDMSELPRVVHDMIYHFDRYDMIDYRKPKPEPKLIGTVKVSNPHLFGKVLKVLASVDDGEVPLHFNPADKTIGFTFMEPSEVRMIDAAYPACVPTNLRSRSIMNPDGPIKLFGKMKKGSAGDVFEFDVYDQQFVFRLDGDALLKMTIPTFRPNSKPLKPPAISFTINIDMEIKTLLDALDPIAKLKLERVKFRFDERGNLVVAGSNMDDDKEVASTTLTQSIQFVPRSVDPSVSSTYDTKLLLDFLKPLKQLTDMLTLEFSKDTPMRISVTTEGLPYLRFYQAAIAEN